MGSGVQDPLNIFAPSKRPVQQNDPLGIFKKKVDGEDLSNGVEVSTTEYSQLPYISDADNPDPVFSFKRKLAANKPAPLPEILFSGDDKVALNDLAKKHNVTTASFNIGEKMRKVAGIEPIPVVEEVSKRPFVEELQDASQVENALAKQITQKTFQAFDTVNVVDKLKVNEEINGLQQDLNIAKQLRKKAAVELNIGYVMEGQDDIEANVKTDESGNQLKRFLNSDFFGGMAKTGGTSPEQATFNLEKLPSQFFIGLGYNKDAEPVVFERITDALKNGLPISESQVAVITAQGIDIEQAATQRKLQKNEITPQQFNEKINELNTVRRDNILNNDETLRAFLSDGAANILDELGKVKQVAKEAVSPILIIPNYLFGHTWNYSDAQIKWATEKTAADNGLDPQDGRIQKQIKYLQDNEGAMFMANSIAKSSGVRELFTGLAQPIRGIANSVEDLSKSSNDVYVEAQSQGNVNVSEKRLKSEDTGVRGILNDVLKGTGQFATQAALMYATSGLIGNVSKLLTTEAVVATEGLAAEAIAIAPVNASVRNVVADALVSSNRALSVGITAYGQSYDSNLKNALNYTSDNDLAKRAAAINSGMEWATEMILSPLDIVKGIASKFRSKGTTEGLLKVLSDKNLLETPDKLRDYLSKTLKAVSGTSYVAGAEIGEEFITQISDYVTNAYLNPNSQTFQNRDLQNELANTAYQTGLSMAIPALLNGVASSNANTFAKGSLLIAAQNRQRLIDGLNEDLALNNIDQDTYNEKAAIINAAAVANAQLPLKADGAKLNTDEKADYIFSRVSEEAMKKKIEVSKDEAEKRIFENKIKEQQDFRTELLNAPTADLSQNEPTPENAVQTDVAIELLNTARTERDLGVFKTMEDEAALKTIAQQAQNLDNNGNTDPSEDAADRGRMALEGANNRFGEALVKAAIERYPAKEISSQSNIKNESESNQISQDGGQENNVTTQSGNLQSDNAQERQPQQEEVNNAASGNTGAALTTNEVQKGIVTVPVKNDGVEIDAKYLDDYKGHKIVEIEGDVYTYDPKNEVLFKVALDDSKSSGSKKVIPEANNVETAKQYIDWKEGADKGNKFVKPIDVTPKPDVSVLEGDVVAPEKVFTKNALDRADAKKVYQQVREVGNPTDADQIALGYIANGGKVSEAVINEVSGTVKSARLNTGAKEKRSNEYNERDYAKPGEETLDELAHHLWELSGQEISEWAIKNSLMDAINSHATRLEAGKSYLERYSPEYAEQQQYEKFLSENVDAIIEEENAINDWLNSETELEIAAMADKDFVNNLINNYEKDNQGENKQSPTQTEKRSSNETGSNASNEKTKTTNVNEATQAKQEKTTDQVNERSNGGNESVPTEESGNTETATTETVPRIESGTTAQPKVGRWEQKGIDIAEKILATELPSWAKIDKDDVKTKGASASEIKKALANAVITMGKLLDKGVEFAEAVKQAVKELVGLLGEEQRQSIEDGFAKYYNDNINNTEGQDEDFLKAFDLRTSTKLSENESIETLKKQGYNPEMMDTKEKVETLELDLRKDDAADIVQKAKEVWGDDITVWGKKLYQKALGLVGLDKTLDADNATGEKQLITFIKLRKELNNAMNDLTNRINFSEDKVEQQALKNERAKVQNIQRQVNAAVEKLGNNASRKLNLLRIEKSFDGVTLVKNIRSKITGEQISNDFDKVNEAIKEEIGVEEVKEQTQEQKNTEIDEELATDTKSKNRTVSKRAKTAANKNKTTLDRIKALAANIKKDLIDPITPCT